MALREECEEPLGGRMKRCYPPSCPLLQAKYAQIEASAASMHNLASPVRRRGERGAEGAGGDAGAGAGHVDSSDSEGPGPWDDDVGSSDSSESGPDSALPNYARWMDDDSDCRKAWVPAPVAEEDLVVLSGSQRLLVRCASIMFGLGLLFPPLMLMSVRSLLCV